MEDLSAVYGPEVWFHVDLGIRWMFTAKPKQNRMWSRAYMYNIPEIAQLLYSNINSALVRCPL